MKSYNESIQHGYQICHIIVSYMQPIQYGYCTSSNGISIMYQLSCSTRSNYNIPTDSSNLLHGTQLHDDPRLCPVPVFALTLTFSRRRCRGHPAAAAAAITAVSPPPLPLSAYCCFQVKLAPPPSLLLLSCHFCRNCCLID